MTEHLQPGGTGLHPSSTRSPFGRALTAVVTPMRPDGSLDLDGLRKVVSHLLDTGHDGVVVNGTTGESATTTDDEKVAVIEAALEAVGDRAVVVAGAGTNNTAHSVHQARQAAHAGAHGILAVTPYYNRPTQTGLVAHFAAVADATDLPVMLYDIPARTGTAIATDTLIRLAEHPRIVAVKDAKGDLWAATHVMAVTDLVWYSGDDVLTLAHLTQGGVGYVGVTSHVAGSEYAAMLAAVDAGDLPTAVAIHRRLIPLVDALMTTSQGAIMAKAALHELGVIDSAAVRLPLVESPPEHLAILRHALSLNTPSGRP
ncbi:4-hydroxy-tetrahydrodipicolinate synthase [Lapillicoccus sp.]|uniref:4-hydroxy-tetrahydrodipicolinate synthase n=1 Tax=Lapillicoccus sp. TaxID=1909287 RepID=UPI0032675646